MNACDLPFFAALARFGRFPAADLRAAVEKLGSAEAVWKARPAALLAAGVGPGPAFGLATARKGIDPAKEIERIYKESLTVVTLDDERYPQALRPLPDPPVALFVRGRTEALAGPLPLAMVGTRSMTAYGEAATRLLAEPLAAAGATIVSGLALGVDAVAHASALAVGGLTVAVLGTGPDRHSVGPRSNAALAERIVAGGGALVSEYPPGTDGRKDHFPMRNRIIAGLSRGVIVVEAAMRSGSRITAKAALEYGRDVFAVPGPIDRDSSAGANDLLRHGAVPAIAADDILGHYGLAAAPEAAAAPNITDPDQKKLLETLARDALTADELALRTGLPTNRLLAAAAALELAGRIARTGQGWAARFDRPKQRRLLFQT